MLHTKRVLITMLMLGKLLICRYTTDFSSYKSRFWGQI